MAMAVTEASRGNTVIAVVFMIAAAAARTCNAAFRKLAYAVMSAHNVSTGRVFGALGYALALAGFSAAAHPVLAMHYGLIGVDSWDVLDRVAAGVAALRHAN